MAYPYDAAGESKTALYLRGAMVIADVLGDEYVKEKWDSPSVLEEQRVSGLAAHLARSGVLVVGEYLEKGVPEGPVDYESAAAYFAAVVAPADEELHRAVRARAAELASVGQTELQSMLRERLGGLAAALSDRPLATPIEVIGGKVMRLGDYLDTRIVEQCVHLDDLARSVGRAPWTLPEGHRETTFAVGIAVANEIHGSDAVVRALYRRGFAEETFPVF